MTENQFQIMVAKFLDTCLVDAWWTAINPIPAKSKAAAGISKAMGMKAGCPDILIVSNGKAVFLELKTEKGSVSNVQKETCHAIINAGGVVHVCRSLEEVVNRLNVEGIKHRGMVAIWQP